MANHGYLPHNGIGTIDQFITQTYAVFGMGVDISTILAIIGAVQDGDLIKSSIGGAPKDGSLLNIIGLLRKPKGLNGSHNKYETDASPTRGDLYERYAMHACCVSLLTLIIEAIISCFKWISLNNFSTYNLMLRQQITQLIS
jgi:hypothetical protein